MRILGVVVDQLVHLGELPAVAGVLHLGVPPRVLEVDDVFLHAVVQVGHFADLAPFGFDPHPVALLDAVLGGRLRVDLHARHGPQLAAPGQLTMLGVEVHRYASSSDAGNGILLVRFRIDHRAVCGLCIIRQRFGSEPGCKLRAIRPLREERFDGSAPKLMFHRRCGEPRFIDVQLSRLLMGSQPIRLPHLVSTVRAPVFRDLAFHVPPTVLLECSLQLVPIVVWRASLDTALNREVFDFEIGIRFVLEPRIVAVKRWDAEILRQLHEVQRIAFAFARRINSFHA